MPFPEEACLIALLLQHFGDRDFTDTHAAGVRREDAKTKWIASRQTAAARRRTQRRSRIEAIKPHTTGSHLVQIRRFQNLVSIKANIPPALIVTHNQNDVGRRLFRQRGILGKALPNTYNTEEYCKAAGKVFHRILVFNTGRTVYRDWCLRNAGK